MSKHLERFKKLEHLEKIHFVILWVVRAFIIAAMLISAYEFSWMILFVSSLAFVLTFLPFIFEKRYEIDLPAEFEMLIVLFIYAAIFLGEVKEYYTRFWWWDIILHAGSAIALGFAGFLILFVLYKTGKFKASARTLALFSFCFALALGSLWEIFEFAMDSFFGLNMQKSGLMDTMWDLILDACGAALAAFLGYLYVKRRELFFLDKLIKRFEIKNPSLFKKK